MDAYLKEFITVNEGLPSNEVYYIIQDRHKYLWFCTDNGIVKYDGNKIRVFNSNNGLPNNTVFKLYEQPDGKIYGEAMYNKLFVIENDSIYPYPYNNVIAGLIPDYSRCISFYKDSLANIHLGTKPGYYIINNKGKVIYSDHRIIENPLYHVIKFIRFPGYIFVYTSLTDNPAINEFIIQVKPDHEQVVYPTKFNKNLGHANYTAIIDQKAVIIYGSDIYVLGGSVISQSVSYNKPPVSVTTIDSLLWVGTSNGGVYSYKMLNDSLKQVDHFLDGLTVTSVLKDHEGGYWFSTREQGVVHLYDFDVAKIFESNSNQNISTFFHDSKNDLVGFDNGYVESISCPGINHLFNSQITSIAKIDSNHLMFFNSGNISEYSLKNKTISNYKTKDWEKEDLAYNMIKASDSLLIFYSFYHFFVCNKYNKKIIFRLNKSSINSRVNSVYVNKNRILAGTSKGLSFFDRHNYQLIKSISLPSHVVSIMPFNNKLYIACKNGNTYLLNNDTLSKLNYLKAVPYTIIYDAAIVDSTLIVAANSGIYKYVYNSKNDVWADDETINIAGIIKIKVFDGQIYYLSKKEIYKDLNAIKNKTVPITKLKRVIINGKVFSTRNPVALKYNQNNIRFNVNAISYSSRVQTYRYRLIGFDNEVRYTNDQNMSYSLLNPGDYEFIVSSTINGIDYSNDQHFSFTINPPFWKTNWFIILLIVTGILLIIIIYYRQLKKVKTGLALKESIAKLKSQALASQLNPHLVFNVLNSIQGLISEEETEEANIYLAKFSKFMRNSLSTSKKMAVSLDEEIKLTNAYIELEMLRFKNNVSISLTNHVKYSTYALPPLIIQPFIENAIKHGVMPAKKEHGKIDVIIDEADGYLLISIEDNGVGFRDEPDFTTGDGMRISLERLKILNAKNEIYLDKSSNVTKIVLKIFS